MEVDLNLLECFIDANTGSLPLIAGITFYVWH